MDHRIAWAVDEIERSLAEPLAVARLAAGVNLSPSRFAHLFREEVGVSPMRFVRDRRMERAAMLLERTFLSVKEVMAQVGCKDPSHFARDFRRCHGSAPREWRVAVGARSQEPSSPVAQAVAHDSTESGPQDPPTKTGRGQTTRGP